MDSVSGTYGPRNTVNIPAQDLAYSVKNVKRDFSNGFLVAEIYSRFYNKDVQMHSFDNGIALRIKKDNWSQILKFFRKVGIQDMITQHEVNQIIHCEDDAVVEFVNRMYEALTQRVVQKNTRRLSHQRSPPFSRETSCAAIRSSLHGATLAETDDSATRASRLIERVSLHEQNLQEERSLEPDRFHIARVSDIGSSGPPCSLARAPQLVGAESSLGPQVTVKAIQVRQIDHSIAQQSNGQEISSITADVNEPPISQRIKVLSDIDNDGAVACKISAEDLVMLQDLPLPDGCLRLVDKAVTISTAFASATAIEADKQAANLTLAQMQRLREAGVSYDAASAHAQAADYELRAFKDKLALAQAAYRDLKND